MSTKKWVGFGLLLPAVVFAAFVAGVNHGQVTVLHVMGLERLDQLTEPKRVCESMTGEACIAVGQFVPKSMLGTATTPNGTLL